MDEVLLIDKPQGWTSFDIVAKVRGELRRLTGDKKVKVGPAGTLDPMATGLLIVLTGNMTKQQDDFMKKDKVYEAEITLGGRSDTDDADGKVISTEYEVRGMKIRQEEIIEALRGFVGEIEQMPPNYSAIKLQGKKAYEIARTGEKPALKSRTVTIYSIENVVVDGLKVRFSCHVSSGTYIRSLARDLGEKLGCGGYLSALRRTKIGDYTVSKAYAISDINSGFFQKTVATTE